MGIHLSHFEPEDADNKQTPLKLKVMKKIVDKVQIETRQRIDSTTECRDQGTTEHDR
jgi:hypothetical protein